MESSESNLSQYSPPLCLNASQTESQPVANEVQSGVQPSGTRSVYWRHSTKRKRTGQRSFAIFVVGVQGGEDCIQSLGSRCQRMQLDPIISGGGVDLFSNLNAAIDEQNEEEQLEEISNEVDKHIGNKLESRQNLDFNLLDWWKGSSTRYPILSKIAKDVLAIPSSTVASESAFSLGKRIVDPFRSSLSPKMVEALVCANDWLRASKFSLYKDPTDEELELYREVEEIETISTALQTQSPGTTSSQAQVLTDTV